MKKHGKCIFVLGCFFKITLISAQHFKVMNIQHSLHTSLHGEVVPPGKHMNNFSHLSSMCHSVWARPFKAMLNVLLTPERHAVIWGPQGHLAGADK